MCRVLGGLGHRPHCHDCGTAHPCARLLRYRLGKNTTYHTDIARSFFSLLEHTTRILGVTTVHDL